MGAPDLFIKVIVVMIMGVEEASKCPSTRELLLSLEHPKGSCLVARSEKEAKGKLTISCKQGSL